MAQLALALRNRQVKTNDTSSHGFTSLRSPRLADWQHFGMRAIRQLSEGSGRRTFLGEVNRELVIAKLTDRRVTDQRTHELQLRMLRQLSLATPLVRGPARYRDNTTNRLADWRVVVYPHTYGLAPNPLRKSDVELMGRSLAAGHRAMAKLPPYDFAMVRALRAADIELPADAPFQLIHGDFSGAKLLLSDDGVNVFDFDDCGYGPVEFDLASALGTAVRCLGSGESSCLFDQFRRWFVDAYHAESGCRVDDRLLDEMMRLLRGFPSSQ